MRLSAAMDHGNDEPPKLPLTVTLDAPAPSPDTHCGMNPLSTCRWVKDHDDTFPAVLVLAKVAHSRFLVAEAADTLAEVPLP